MKFIDLRSDTVTHPTEEMREAMFNAEVGDDVYSNDPTTIELENFSANLLGKEAGLFVPSGTFGNQLAILTHCKRGSEVILNDDCHIVQHETGATGVISNVQLRTIDSKNGMMPLNLIESKIRKETEDVHSPETSLICLENAHSRGTVLPIKYLEDVKNLANRYKIPIHLDGARLFNAQISLGVPVTEITKNVDTIMFCLSKGLCAPIGSMLVGSQNFINKARKNRKMLGGGMRQVGFLAAAGLVALKNQITKLNEDHLIAKKLARALSRIPYISLNEQEIEINMIFFKINKDFNNTELVNFFKSKNILISSESGNVLRFVTHQYIKENHIPVIVNVLTSFFNS